MEQLTPQQINRFAAWQKDPLEFVKDMWGLVPQPLKHEYTMLADTLPAAQFKPDMFQGFVKGVHVTWQQWLVFRAVKRALQGIDKNRIAIESGHGTGKSMTLSMLILWYLTCFPNSQIPCTAPTDAQLKDILWKEITKWHGMMPIYWKDQIEIVEGYVRIKEAAKTWFARGRTSSPEHPEALAGVHGDFVCVMVDEASGVHEKVFETAEGVLTNENILFIMASNHTRLTGYYHAAFTTDKAAWQLLSLDSRQSPIVDWGFVQRIIDKYGEDSDVFRVRVAGTAPKVESIDDGGYVPLLVPENIKWAQDAQMLGRKKLGVDPAGEGDDETKWVLRSPFKAMVVGTEKISDAKSIAQKTLTLMTLFEVHERDVTVDNFGEGANVAVELAKAGKSVKAVNVGETIDAKTHPEEHKEFINLRAMASWRLRNWARQGGELVQNDGFSELLVVKYTRNLAGKIQIMSKKEMRKQGIKSPNTFDALMLTFVQDDVPLEDEEDDDEDGEGSVVGSKHQPSYPDIGV